MTPDSTVVTGLGVVCAIGFDVPSFTEALRAGRSGVEAVDELAGPETAGLLATVHDFDLPTALDRCHGLAPRVRDRILRAGHRSPPPIAVALAVAVQGWLDADLGRLPVPAERIGLIVGGHNLTSSYAFDQHETYEREPAFLPARYALHAQDTDHVGTISEALGIMGEGYTVGASSASGNAAVIHAARLISCGAVDVCLAIGALSQLDPQERSAFAQLGVLAEPDDDVAAADGPRPFDKGRSGFVPGEGSACLVLESRTGARRRGVPALAELAGFAMALDGNSLANPSVEGEARAMSAALRQAGVGGADLDYVNAHATATPAGDDAEVRALLQVFGDRRPWVNSTKALVGHCLSAAGAIEAVATVVQMWGGFVHPNPNSMRPVDNRLRLVGTSAVSADITCALSNSFGFGGFNTSLVFLRD